MHPRYFLLAIVVVLTWRVAMAADELVVGELVVDPPTYCCLGVSLPITSGDDDYDAKILVSYRKTSGSAAWREAMPLMRVRPETVPFGFSVPEQFAGSIFDLEPGTSYEVKLAVQDPDGVNIPEITTVLKTRSLPRSNPQNPSSSTVSTIGEWQTALDNAVPGDVIVVANGTYKGNLQIKRSGTDVNPIFIRGESQEGVILDATGLADGVVVHTGTNGPTVEHVFLEDFTITGSDLGVRLLGAHDVVVQRLHITGVSAGVNGTTYVEAENRSYENANLTVCDNVLEGREVVWPTSDQSVWNFEGIVIEGSGHVICHNTLSGFGDALGIEICYGGTSPSYCPLYPPPNRNAVRNRAIDFYGNDILFGGDDGIELDFAERNVRAFRNRISNTQQGISFQPTWGGPVYAFRNVIYNVINRTYKLNNEPTGFYILHNTSVRNGTAWTQPSPSQEINGMRFFNNLLVGTNSALSLRTLLVMDHTTNNVVEIDHNGWFPDGSFQFLPGNFSQEVYADINSLSANSPFESNGTALTAPIFENLSHALGPISAPALDPPADITPHPNSGAVDRGIVLSNINDAYSGVAPDLGALERSDSMPQYGPRPANDSTDRIAPAPPTELRID